MKKRHSIYALAAFISAAAACKATLPGEVVSLTEKDAGRAIVLKAGDILQVTLASNPTTGYRWTVKEVSSLVLKQDGEPVYKGSQPEAVGSGGTQTFRFLAFRPGSTALKMIYRRPWEASAPPDATFEIACAVK